MTLSKLESCANLTKIVEFLNQQSSLNLRTSSQFLYRVLMPISVAKHEFRTIPKPFRWTSEIRAMQYTTRDYQKLPKVDEEVATQLHKLCINGSSWYSTILTGYWNFLAMCPHLRSLEVSCPYRVTWDYIKLPTSLKSLKMVEARGVHLKDLPECLQILNIGSLIIEPSSVLPAHLTSLAVHAGFKFPTFICPLPIFPESLLHLSLNFSNTRCCTRLSLPSGLQTFILVDTKFVNVTVARFPPSLQLLRWESFA